MMSRKIKTEFHEYINNKDIEEISVLTESESNKVCSKTLQVRKETSKPTMEELGRRENDFAGDIVDTTQIITDNVLNRAIDSVVESVTKPETSAANEERRTYVSEKQTRMRKGRPIVEGKPENLKPLERISIKGNDCQNRWQCNMCKRIFTSREITVKHLEEAHMISKTSIYFKNKIKMVKTN